MDFNNPSKFNLWAVGQFIESKAIKGAKQVSKASG